MNRLSEWLFKKFSKNLIARRPDNKLDIYPIIGMYIGNKNNSSPEDSP